MGKYELLRQYADFAYKNHYQLSVTGVSKRVSKIWVISYDESRIYGKFVFSGDEMTYKFSNIDFCEFTDTLAQDEFDQHMICVNAYGNRAEEMEIRFNAFKEYYQKIVLQRRSRSNGTQSVDLEKLSFERLERIFQDALYTPDSLLAHFISGRPFEENQSTEETPILLLSRSNLSQKQAIEKALNDRISVIEGPPGTGKTTTILSLLANLIFRGKHVVVVSKNNSAIDNIREELDARQLPPFYLRLGEKGIMQNLDKTLKPVIQEILDRVAEIPEQIVDHPRLYSLYTEIKALEADINRLVEVKNKILEDKNILRHIEKRNSSFQEERRFQNLEKFQNRNLDSMRHEIDRIASALQKVYYHGYCSLWDRIKNRVIWRLKPAEFESDGLLLLFQLEYIYLTQEIAMLSSELEASGLQDQQHKLAGLYDHEYIHVSVAALQAMLWAFYNDEDVRELITGLQNASTENIYKKYKDYIREVFPVVLTTADALVFNYSDFIANNEKIDYIIIDEASQCDLISGLPVLALADHCVIVGDRKQLTAITGERPADLADIEPAYDYFAENLLSSVQKVFSLEPTLLREHYRCDYSIINYCNKFYYDNELIIYTDAHSDAMQIVNINQGKYAQTDPVIGSFFNEREIKAIESLTGPTLDRAYVITPFKAQGEHLREHFNCGKEICGTIHTFQGRGEDTVYFSSVLNDLPFANSHLSSQHCLFQKELINVAVSRAKKRFVMVCDVPYLRQQNEEMRNLIDYIHSYGIEIPDKTVCLFDGLYQKITAYTPHDKLDNVFEETVYEYIRAYCSKRPGMYCRVKLPLADLVTDQTYLFQNPDIRNFVLHRNTHVDFTLCNAIDNPILVIELDGQSHAKSTQKVRDKKKDAALEHMEIPLWRLSSKSALTKEEFEHKIDVLLGGNDSAPE